MDLARQEPPLQAVVARLADTIRANYLRIDEPDQPMTEEEARRLAEDVLQRLLERERFPRLSDRRGLLFVVEEGAGSGGRDVLHVMAWNGERWVGIDAIELPLTPR